MKNFKLTRDRLLGLIAVLLGIAVLLASRNIKVAACTQ